MDCFRNQWRTGRGGDKPAGIGETREWKTRRGKSGLCNQQFICYCSKSASVCNYRHQEERHRDRCGRLTSCHRCTRKPRWRKGKRATAMSVWRPLAKKSSANQRYAISFWWLITALLTACKISSRFCRFRALYDCKPPTGGTPTST